MTLSASCAHAQHRWAMIVSTGDSDKPAVIEYHSEEETAKNGTTYSRIYDDGWRFRRESYSPLKLRYGYRLADKQMYVYDFESGKETLAFDFRLSVGDSFTTFNNMEWKIVGAKDTIVNRSFCGMGESVSKRLLTARTLDGRLTDRWLEDFGSFLGHFLIEPIGHNSFSQTLWMRYAMGEYLAREINEDPFFAHDSGWMERIYGKDQVSAYAQCRLENGSVVFENYKWAYEHRDYTCFYREGDSIYKIYNWEMEPHIDGGTPAMRKDEVVFMGMPSPTDGKYVVHIDEREYPTGIAIPNLNDNLKPETYDLQGRRQQEKSRRGVYIRDGRKYVAE